MIRFANELEVTDLTYLSKEETKTEYKTQTKGVKSGSSGKPPIELNAVEALIDLRLCIEQGEYEEAMGYYLYLKRLTHR